MERRPQMPGSSSDKLRIRPEGERIRIRLVIDQLIFKEGLRALIDADDEFCCVDDRWGKDIDATVVDLDNGDALQFAESSSSLGAKLLVLAEKLHPTELETLVKSDVRAVVAKTIDGRSLLGALSIVARGGKWLDPGIIEPTRAEQTSKTIRKRRWASLTVREREVAVLLLRGVQPDIIGVRLGVSTHTVRGHRRNVYAKLHIGSRLELSRYAFAHVLATDARSGD